MTAASGDPGEKPDHDGRPPAGAAGVPPPDPAYAALPPDPAPAGYPAPVDYPAPPVPPWPAAGTRPGPPPLRPAGYAYPAPLLPRPGVNALAIVSLATSVSGVLCCPGLLVGPVTGVIALMQIRRTGETGVVLALSGIVVGLLMLLGAVVAMSRLAAIPVG